MTVRIGCCRRGLYSGNSPTIKRMPQTNRTVRGVLGGLLGLVGLSAVAGVLATAAVTPAIAIAGVSGSQALSIFENLPDSLTPRSEEHTSELQSRENLVCRLLLEKKKSTLPTNTQY